MKPAAALLLAACFAGVSVPEQGLAEPLEQNVGLIAYRKRDFERAATIFKAQASRGDTASAAMLGVMYFHGEGMPKDMESADKWTKPAADAGNAIAQYIQGLLASQPSGGKAPDYKKAFEWMRLAAQQGNAGAQVSLGALYFQGLGVTQDNSLGFYWSQKAAAQGDSHGQDNLARAYLLGAGVPADADKAVYWYREAGKQGYAKAINALGLMYVKGQGVTRDAVLAYSYFDIAGKLGLEAARMNQAALHQQLTDTELNAARKLTASWTSGAPLPKN